MKMNTTYKLHEVLDALVSANDRIVDKLNEMKREGIHDTCFHSFDAEGMLTTSPFARVTFTHRDANGDICGYMETSPYKDGVRCNVKVVERWSVIKANEDYTKITFED